MKKKDKNETIDIVYSFLRNAHKELKSDKIYIILKEVRDSLSTKINVNNILFYISTSDSSYSLYLNINGSDHSLITIKKHRKGSSLAYTIVTSDSKKLTDYTLDHPDFSNNLKLDLLEFMNSSRYLKVLLYDLTKIYH
ncbi:MAG: hypothetical protein ACOC56_03530 [Atribacterota bacterium]